MICQHCIDKKHDECKGHSHCDCQHREAVRTADGRIAPLNDDAKVILSKYSDDELVKMAKSHDLAPDGRYVSHIAYEIINTQVRMGRQWAKCPNCGNPYPLDKEGSDSTCCSEKCFQEYVEYVTEEARA